VVRPDALVDGAMSEYETHEAIVGSLFRAEGTRLASAAHFMAELATDEGAWRRWRGKMPVIVDGAGASVGGPSRPERP
jgi:hypothetical protein